MHRFACRLTVAALAVVGVFVAAPAANATIDPLHTGKCLASSAGHVATVIDLSHSSAPIDAGALGCFAAP